MAKKRATKEGSIHQLPSGSWRAQVSLEGKRLAKTFKKQGEAREWIAEMRRRIDAGMPYLATQMQFGKYAENWLEAVKPHLRESTWSQYRRYIEEILKPKLGSLALQELRADHIQQLYNDLQEEGEEQRGIPTIQKMHCALHKCLSQAVKQNLLQHNPAGQVIVPKGENREMAILDESQVSQLLIAAKETRYEALFTLAIHTGMRQMELLGLKWEDLDWNRRIIQVQRQLLRKQKGKDWKFAPTKTRAGKRPVVIGTKTLEVLRAHYEQQRIDRMLAWLRWQDFGLIFPTTIGTPMIPRNMLHDFKAILQAAGLPNIRFHDLRHTAVSLMLNHNIPLIVVSKRIGHARPSITLDLYAHLLPGLQAEAAELMDEIMTPVEIDIARPESSSILVEHKVSTK